MKEEYFEIPDYAPVIGGVYSHYKSNDEYKVTGLSLNSDTNEWHVEYIPLYKGASALKFNRSLVLWMDKATLDGKEVERYTFKRVE